MKLHTKRIGFCFVLILSSNLISAQYINNINIASPAEIAGDYPVIQPRWAEVTAPSFSGTATFVTDSLEPLADGCQAFVESVEGKIAFIDRGNCSDSIKITSAHESGAIAVVLCNEEPAVIGCLDYNLNRDLDSIPLFSISYESCQKIRVFLEGGEAEVTFNFECSPPTYGDEVIWGDKTGEGDFSGGLNDWVVVNDMDSDTTWAWYDTPTLPDLFCTGVIGGSACNGYMAFPSSHYANPDLGTPLCQNNTSEFCSGALISPTIDLSGHTIEGLFVGVRHDVRYWLSGSTSLIVSYDDGVTWPDSIHMSSGIAASGSLNPEIGNNPDCQINSSAANTGFNRYLTFPIGNYQGQESIKLQFRHLGSYYFATVDDVTLINKKYSDIELLRSFYAQAPARNIPVCQAQEIPLLIKVNNLGNEEAVNVSVAALAYNPHGSLESTYTNNRFQDQPVDCFLDENLEFLETHTQSKIIGTHSIKYENLTENDANKENDTLSFSYNIVDNHEPWLSIERPIPDSDNLYTNIWTDRNSFSQNSDYAVAYTFYLPQGDDWVFESLRFGMNPLVSNSGDIKIYLYLWNPTEASFLNNRETGEYLIAPEDRILLGCMAENIFGSIENWQPMNSAILGLKNVDDMTVGMAVADPNTGQPKLDSFKGLIPLELQDDQMYALVFVMNSAPDMPKLEMLARPSPLGSKYDLSGYNFAMDALGKPYRAGTALITDLTEGGDFETELSTLSFPGHHQQNSVWLEMDIRPTFTEGCNIVGTNDLRDDLSTNIEVFPNPTTDKFFIEVKLNAISAQVTFELININGERVKTMTEDKVKSGRYIMEVDQLPSGVYTLNVRSETGFTSKKVILTR